ncbi:Oxidoreductase, molybdopterin-binding domain-containing protein [Chiua virens]|nr:Oxidoreductase, molybdopterin-binding domain-containing protein [Chiua virens]
MGVKELINLDKKLYNAEPRSLVELTNHPITPWRLVYARNHSDIKDLRTDTVAEDYTVKIDGEIEDTKSLDLTLTFGQLRDMPRKQVLAVLVCAGNRRAKMAEKTGRDVDGIKWSEGTAANVLWSGVPLRDVLLQAGVPDDSASWQGLHACFASYVAPCDKDTWYGGSIPLEKAMRDDGDVLLAHEMNGEPLTPDHGFPLRIVVPGYSGMRWVKWVDRITISKEESPNFFQQRDYRILPDHVTSVQKANDEGWWSKVPSMGNLPCNSIVTKVKRLPSSCPDELPLQARGYAYSDCPIDHVEISVDAGVTWKQCKVTYQDGPWSWALWEGDVDLAMDEENLNVALLAHNLAGGHGRKFKVNVLSRATDSAGRVQDVTYPWNLRGVGYCGAGEFTIEVPV